MKANELKGMDLVDDLLLYLIRNSGHDSDSHFGYCGPPYRIISVETVSVMLKKYFDIDFNSDDLKKLEIDQEDYSRKVSRKSITMTQKDIDRNEEINEEKERESAIKNLTKYYIDEGYSPNLAEAFAELGANDFVKRVI